VAFGASGAFLGEARSFTRQRFYRDDDADFDASMFGRDANVDVGEDPYEEGRYTALDETPAAIEQLRADVARPQFRALVEARRAQPPSSRPIIDPTAEERVARARQATILAAMANERTSLFSLGYADVVPDEHRAAFLATPIIRTLLALLLPPLYARRRRDHLLESTWIRTLEEAGTAFKGGESRVLVGSLRTLAGAHVQREYERHSHTSSSSPATTNVRILTFEIPMDAAAFVYVRLVLHHVDDERLCFRTFHFLRSLPE